ncbi:MAG: hypothetical protein HC844_09940, partial [Tabrizicola sp.]|nr:hypothetical protein [Tabrizicola sp.]
EVGGGCPVSVNGGPGGNAVGGAGGNGGIAGLGAPGNNKNGGAGGDGGDGGEVAGSTGKDGVLGGFHLGYNWQKDNVVFGVEGDISLTGGLDDYLASLRARLGLASNDMLFYVTGVLRCAKTAALELSVWPGRAQTAARAAPMTTVSAAYQKFASRVGAMAVS